jgi:hypothetical protein
MEYALRAVPSYLGLFLSSPDNERRIFEPIERSIFSLYAR